MMRANPIALGAVIAAPRAGPVATAFAGGPSNAADQAGGALSIGISKTTREAS
jgi:hypothetical protein